MRVEEKLKLWEKLAMSDIPSHEVIDYLKIALNKSDFKRKTRMNNIETIYKKRI
jgi:hypothetical protein